MNELIDTYLLHSGNILWTRYESDGSQNPCLNTNSCCWCIGDGVDVDDSDVCDCEDDDDDCDSLLSGGDGVGEVGVVVVVVVVVVGVVIVTVVNEMYLPSKPSMADNSSSMSTSSCTLTGMD